MAQTGGSRASRAITPVSAREPTPNTTDSSRAAKKSWPSTSRQSDTSQKYNGGCTSVTLRSCAMAASPEWAAWISRARPAGNTVTGQSGRGVPEVRNSVYCSSYSAPRDHAARHRTIAHGNKVHSSRRLFIDSLTNFLLRGGRLPISNPQKLTDLAMPDALAPHFQGDYRPT